MTPRWPSTPPAASWTWDGQIWTRRQPTVAPPAWAAAAMAYGPTVERVVLFSGLGSGDADVRVWDGEEWTDVTPDGAGPAGHCDDTWLLRLR